MLRAARRTITSALATAAVAVAVAMVFSQAVRAAHWVIAWPGDGDRWWSAVVAAGAAVSLVIVRSARTDGATTRAFLRDVDDPPADLRSPPARLTAAATGVGLGAPLGLDGPALHLGGALGAAAGRLFKRSERSWTIAGGVAALSMAIGAPVAAALVVVELGPRRLPRVRDLGPLATGAAAAWLVRRLVGDPGGVLGHAPNLPARTVAPAALALGVVCGLCGGWLAALLARARKPRRPLGPRLAVTVVALGSAVLLGWIATGHPIFVGSGDRMIAWARTSSALPATAALAATVALVTVLVGVDLVGGLLLPVRWIGALIGVVLAQTWLPSGPLTFSIVAGGSALLATAYSVPAAAIALGCAAFGWSAGSWFVALSVGLAIGIRGRRPLVCS